MPHAEAQQDIEVRFFVVQEFGLIHRVAHGFRLVPEDRFIPGKAEERLGGPAGLTHHGDDLEPPGLQERFHDRGLFRQAGAKGEPQPFVVHFLSFPWFAAGATRKSFPSPA